MPGANRFRSTYLGLTVALGLVLNSCGSDSPATIQTATFDTLRIATRSLPLAVVGSMFDYALAATGGDGNNMWSLAAGTLPTGLTLAPSGSFTGVPTLDQAQSFTVRVTSGDGQVADQALVLKAVTLPSLPNRIAFTSDRDRPRFHTVIHTAHIDGSNISRLTSSQIHAEYNPAWSPDGTKLLYHYNGSDGNHEIWTVNADGSDPVQLTSHPEHDQHPSWSPDGTQVVFDADRGPMGPGGQPLTELWIMDADGANARRLSLDSLNSGSRGAWSPDGSVIAFPGARTIVLAHVDGSGIEHLAVQNQSGGLSDPTWSPDGSKIAFSRRIGASPNWNDEIFVIDRDGSNQTNLTNDPAPDGEPAWSPDGSKILFTRYVDGNEEIYIMNADGTQQARLTNAPGTDREPFWPRN